MNKIDMDKYRQADHPIDPIFTKRWSPRSFEDKEVSDEVLKSLFEAARWAPSSANVQPWRFVYAKTAEDRERFLSFLNDGNKIWCKYAPVLAVIIGQKKWKVGGKDINPTFQFDTGTAWGYLALEAAHQGLFAHGMGGFSREKVKEELKISDEFEVIAMVAIGYHGKKENLPEGLQEREVPSGRKKVEEFAMEGYFTE